MHTDVLEAAVGYFFAHFFQLSAEEMLLVEVVVRVFARVHGCAFQFLQLGSNHLVRHPVVVVAEFLEGFLSVAANSVVVFVLVYAQSGR